MNYNITISINSNLFLETCCFLEDASVEIPESFFNKLTQEEQTLIKNFKEDEQSYRIGEFYIHSKDKSFGGVIKFIDELSLEEFDYYYNNQTISMEKISNKDKEKIKANKIMVKELLVLAKPFVEKIIKDVNYDNHIKDVVEQLKTISPLEVAQSFMGKRFARVSDYINYEFVPLYYYRRTPMRFFNRETLVLFIPYKPINNQLNIEEMGDILKVIGDPTRLKIMDLLKEKALYGKEIADKLGVKAPTITHHIEQLNGIKLLHVEEVGRIKYFSLNKKRLKELIEQLNTFTK